MILRLRFAFVLCLSFLLLVTSCDKDDPSPDAPKACFTWVGEEKALMPVTFTSDCSENAVEYHWDFGDSNESDEENPVHTYSSGGEFTVTLTVTNVNGVEHSIAESIEIDEVETMGHFSDINANETWEAGVVHVIFSVVRINNATVTIEPGAIIRFMEGARLEVGTNADVSTATLIARGTAGNPILFTADSETPTAGYWRNITFGNGDSGNSAIEYCTIEYGGGDYTYGDALIKIYGTPVSIQNNTFKKSAGYGVYVDAPGSFKNFTNNIFSDCADGSLLMHPEAVSSISANNTLVGDVMVENGTIESATATWKKLNVPYQMLGGTLYVGSTTGTTWTIEPGTIIKFPHWSDVLVGGFATSKATLIANGTPTEPITFTSLQPAPSVDQRWGALQFGIGTDPLTSLKHCVIENGGITGSTAEHAEVIIKDCSIKIESTKILNSFDYGILLNSEGRFGTFTNNIIDNPGHDGIYLYANWAHTIGTGNTFNAARGILVNTDIITQSSATWLKQPVPYIITGPGDAGLDIYNDTPEGAKLTLSPGVQLLMGTHGSISAGGYGKGALVANGTSAEPILISSAGNPKNKGDWAAIQFSPYTSSGILNYCTIEYGGYTSSGMIHVAGTNIPSITNCIIRNSGSYGIVLQSATPTMSGNTFSGNTLDDVY
jgi:parallel beta-helix repeat protein